LAQISTKSFTGWGFAPDPNGGAYSAPQTPQLYLGALLLSETRGGRKGKGKAGEEDEKKWGERGPIEMPPKPKS